MLRKSKKLDISLPESVFYLDETPGSAEEWAEVLESVDGFDGNTKNAGILMDSFSAGGDYVVQSLISRGLRKAIKPAIGISNYPGALFWFDSQRYMQFADRSFLEQFSRTPPITWIHARSRDGEVGFKGHVIDYFALTGVEETHHGIFRKFKENRVHTNQPKELPSAEYRADDTEFRALKWKVRYAKAEAMPQETIDHLDLILSAARQIRLG